MVAEDYPKLVLTQCASGLPDPIEETSTANNGLTYDALTHTYTYVWKTVKSWKGKCGTFTLKLEDGTEHTADFVFKQVDPYLSERSGPQRGRFRVLEPPTRLRRHGRRSASPSTPSWATAPLRHKR